MTEQSIFITRWGQTGPKVIMVHGSAQGSQVGGDSHFSMQKKLAEQGWQAIVPDRPGHGRSPSPGHPDDAELDAEWVAELLEDGAHLVGHSFGGCVALAAAAKRPSSVLSLTLIEPGMQKLAMDNPVVRKFGLKMLMIIYFSLSPVSRAKNFAKLVHIPPEIRGGSNLDEFRRMGRGIFRLRVPSKEILQEELSKIKQAKIPLLVVTGGWSPAFEATADLVASTGNGRRLVIKSDHHFPQLVSNEFNQALSEFMKENELNEAVNS